MGIAGVSIVFAVFDAFRCIKALVTFFSWHNKEIVGAEVGELVNTEFLGKKQSKYIFSMVLDTSPEKTNTQYEVVADNYDKLSIKTGSRIEVYYDPNKEGKNQYKIKKQVTDDLWQWPLVLAGCIAIFIICMLIAGALSK